MTLPPPVPPTRPAPTGSGRAVGLAIGWLLYVLGVGFLGLPIFVFLFGAPIDPGAAFLIAVVADLLLAAVLVGATLVSRRGRRGFAYGGWIMLAADVLLVAGFVAAYALIVQFAI